MKYVIGFILVALLLILFFTPDKSGTKKEPIANGTNVANIENFETIQNTESDIVRNPYISDEADLCEFGPTSTCQKDRAIIASNDQRVGINNHTAETCGITGLSDLRPECDISVLGDEVFQRVVFSKFDDDRWKVLDPTEFSNQTSFPLLTTSSDGEPIIKMHKAEIQKLDDELKQLPFIQDNRCSFLIDNLANVNDFQFFTDNKILNHPDGPKEPNLCYIPPNVVNVLFADTEKADDPDYKLCSSSNDLIYKSKFRDVVEIVGMDVGRTVDKDIGNPMCVIRFKDKPDNMNAVDYKNQLSEYMKFLHTSAPERQIESGGFAWIQNKFNVDKKIIANQEIDEIAMIGIVDSKKDLYDALAEQLRGYNADPNKYINDYVMHAIDDVYNNTGSRIEDGDPIRELGMSRNCAYHGTDKKDNDGNQYLKQYDKNLKGVGNHISHLETPALSNYLNKWSEYGDQIAKVKSMAAYVNDNADFARVWERSGDKFDDKDAKERKCESTVLRRENGNDPDPWLGFHRIEADLFQGTSDFVYRNDVLDAAERYYRQGCGWNHLEHADTYGGCNLRTASCDWISDKHDDEFNCDEFGSMFVGKGFDPVDKYYTNLSAEIDGAGEKANPIAEKTDKTLVDFLLSTKNDNIRNFRKDGDRCVYRDENDDGCVTESDLPLLPSENEETRVPIYGTGEVGDENANFVWGEHLVVKGNSGTGYTISGSPMPDIEPKLKSVLSTYEEPLTKVTNITLDDEYMVIAEPSSGRPLYVTPSVSDQGLFLKDSNVKVRVVNPTPMYNGNDDDIPDGASYSYMLGEGTCVIPNTKMIVDKNEWIDGTPNAGKITVGDFVSRTGIDKRNVTDPMDSTVVCDLDRNQFENNAVYKATKSSSPISVDLDKYKCDVTKTSAFTVHVNDSTSDKTSTSYISPTVFDSGRAYKFNNKGSHGEFNSMGSSLFFIDNVSHQNQILVDGKSSTLMPGKVYTYSGDENFSYDKFALCDTPGVSSVNGICKAGITSCEADNGPKYPGLYHYKDVTDPTRVNPGVFVYKSGLNSVTPVEPGIKKLSNDIFDSASCTDLKGKLISETRTTENINGAICDIYRKPQVQGSGIIESVANPVVLNPSSKTCEIGSDYVVVGKGNWDISQTLIQPLETQGGKEASSNNFRFNTYGIIPNKNIREGSRQDLGVTSLANAEAKCDTLSGCAGFQHVKDTNRYLMFTELNVSSLNNDPNSSIYVKRAECGTECLNYCDNAEYARDNTSNVFFQVTGVKLDDRHTEMIGVEDHAGAQSMCSLDMNCIGYEIVGDKYHSGRYTISADTGTSIYHKFQACGSKITRAIGTEYPVILQEVILPSDLVDTPIIIYWNVETSPGYVTRRYMTCGGGNVHDFHISGQMSGAEVYKIIKLDANYEYSGKLYATYSITFHTEMYNSNYIGFNSNNIMKMVTMSSDRSSFIFIPNGEGLPYNMCVVQNNNLSYFEPSTFSLVSTKPDIGALYIVKNFIFDERRELSDDLLGAIDLKGYNYTTKIVSDMSVKLTSNILYRTDRWFTNMCSKHRIYTLAGVSVVIFFCDITTFKYVRIFQIDNDKVKGFWNIRESNEIEVIEMQSRTFTCTHDKMDSSNVHKAKDLTSQFLLSAVPVFDYVDYAVVLKVQGSNKYITDAYTTNTSLSYALRLVIRKSTSYTPVTINNKQYDVYQIRIRYQEPYRCLPVLDAGRIYNKDLHLHPCNIVNSNVIIRETANGQFEILSTDGQIKLSVSDNVLGAVTANSNTGMSSFFIEIINNTIGRPVNSNKINFKYEYTNPVFKYSIQEYNITNMVTNYTLGDNINSYKFGQIVKLDNEDMLQIKLGDAHFSHISDTSPSVHPNIFIIWSEPQGFSIVNKIKKENGVFSHTNYVHLDGYRRFVQLDETDFWNPPAMYLWKFDEIDSVVQPVQPVKPYLNEDDTYILKLKSNTSLFLYETKDGKLQVASEGDMLSNTYVKLKYIQYNNDGYLSASIKIGTRYLNTPLDKNVPGVHYPPLNSSYMEQFTLYKRDDRHCVIGGNSGFQLGIFDHKPTGYWSSVKVVNFSKEHPDTNKIFYFHKI